MSVDLAVATASANQTYQIASTAAVADELNATGGTAHAVNQAEAEALTQWVAILGTPAQGKSESSYVAYAQATAEANAADALAAAQSWRKRLMAWQRPTWPTRPPAVRQAWNSRLPPRPISRPSTRPTPAFQNARRDSQTQADNTRSLAYAQADRQHAIGLATAQETYQVAVLNGDSDAQSDLAAAQAEADTNLITGWPYVQGVGPVTGQADADLAWQEAYSGADATFADADAGAAETLAVNLATDQQGYAGNVAQAVAVETVSNAQALPATARTRASGTRRRPPITSRQRPLPRPAAAWQVAHYAAATTALDAMADTLSGTGAADWAQYRSRSGRRQAGLVGQRELRAPGRIHLTTRPTSTASTSIYQQTVDAAYLAEMTADG